ncbi:hypothetical protein LINPERHAP1_LOCUS17753 [Linum perenne]
MRRIGRLEEGQLSVNRREHGRTPRCMKWHPPPEGIVTCNLDASLFEDQSYYGFGTEEGYQHVIFEIGSQPVTTSLSQAHSDWTEYKY